jgi:hypothetical protein
LSVVTVLQPPRWQRTGNCGAHFAFGGRLIQFGRMANEDEMIVAKQPIQRVVDVKIVCHSSKLLFKFTNEIIDFIDF